MDGATHMNTLDLKNTELDQYLGDSPGRIMSINFDGRSFLSCSSEARFR